MTDATFVRSDDDDGPPTLTVTLDPPMLLPKSRGETIAEFTLTEPKARQMREAEKERQTDAPLAGEIAYQMRLIVLVGKLRPNAADVLPVGVVNQCMVFLEEFIFKVPDEDEAVDSDSQGPETLAIDPPITFGGREYTELDLVEPMASEVRNARLLMREPGNLFEHRRAAMHLITTVSKLPSPVIDELRISTLNKAGRILGRFTTAGRPALRR